MNLLRAYTLFILILMVPAILLALVVWGLLFGVALAHAGLGSGRDLMAATGFVLLAVSGAGLIAGWWWGLRGRVGPARVVRLAPLTAAMVARPRTLKLSSASGNTGAIAILGRHFDRIVSQRRDMPGAAVCGERTIEEYGTWLDQWHLVVPDDPPGTGEVIPGEALRLVPLEGRPSPPYFSVRSAHDKKRLALRASHWDGKIETPLVECEVPLRRPLLTHFQMTGELKFVRSPLFSKALRRMYAARPAMLEALAAELAAMDDDPGMS